LLRAHRAADCRIGAKPTPALAAYDRAAAQNIGILTLAADRAVALADLSIEVCRAEDKVFAKFGILSVVERDMSSLEDRDKAIFWEGLKRMEAGLPQSYKDQLEAVLTRVNNLAWMRIYYRNDIGAFLRCFA
jgi:hypothetical protein